MEYGCPRVEFELWSPPLFSFFLFRPRSLLANDNFSTWRDFVEESPIIFLESSLECQTLLSTEQEGIGGNVCVFAVVPFRSRVLSHETKTLNEDKTLNQLVTAPLQKHFVVHSCLTVHYYFLFSLSSFLNLKMSPVTLLAIENYLLKRSHFRHWS